MEIASADLSRRVWRTSSRYILCFAKPSEDYRMRKKMLVISSCPKLEFKMATLNQIKSKLLELEGGVFQRLCDDWLHRKGYENINPIGMMQTTDRVVKGTPDTLLIQKGGKYVFSEYTVQQDRLFDKILDDIDKCLDEGKMGIKIDQISEIIICYLGKLTTSEINKLSQKCIKLNIVPTLCGLDSIAFGIKNCYPILSEEYLGLSLDTGQILSTDDFVARY